MTPTSRTSLLLVWACFLVRGCWYTAALPLWEGFDEYAHFAVLQHWIAAPSLPAVDNGVSREIAESLRLAPLPWELRYLGPPYLTHEEWWALPRAEREARKNALSSMPREWAREPAPDFLASYEAQQPPLYYWICALPFRAAQSLSLTARVLLIRLLSVAMASLAIPLTFLAASLLFPAGRISIGCTAVIAVMPGFLFDTCRVGNDSLAVAIFAGLLLALIARRSAVAVGVLLGLGLLTKAYFLTAIPAVVILMLVRRAPWRSWLAILGLPAAIAGWWYARAWLTTGSISGWSEAANLRGLPLAELFYRAAALSWLHAVDAIFNSYLWFGGWSFLTLRSWMYRIFAALFLYAAVRAVLGFRRDLLPAALIFCWFSIGMAYNVVVTFSNHGISASTGWYFYAVLPASILLVARRDVLLTAALAFAALDLYSMNIVALPYYTGLLAHRAGGGIPAFHLDQFTAQLPATLSRISVPVSIAWAMWIFYLAATITPVALARRK